MITGCRVTEVLAKMNQTSAPEDRDAQWMHFRTDKRKGHVTKQLAILRIFFALKYDTS